jgi:hypothetical protein
MGDFLATYGWVLRPLVAIAIFLLAARHIWRSLTMLAALRFERHARRFFAGRRGPGPATTAEWNTAAEAFGGFAVILFLILFLLIV